MKTLTLLKSSLFLIVSLIFFFFGCSDDPEELNNAFRIGADVYSINDGIIVDNGLWDLVNDDVDEYTHYSYIFWMTDGKVAPTSNYLADSSATYALILFTYAPVDPAGGEFSEGIFKNVGDQDFYNGLEEMKDNYLFARSYACFDENNDGIVEFNEGLVPINGGIDRIFGDPEKYNMNFTFNFSLGKKAEGRYSGPIPIYVQ